MSVVARREKEKFQRRNAILKAARHLFFEKGYRTTMDEIAERAHLGKGTLYLYFKGKDELYVSVILEGFKALEKRMQEQLAKVDIPEEKARAVFFSFVDHCLENREYFRITQYFLTEDARSNTSPKLIETINMATMRLLEYGIRATEEGIETGRFRDDIDPMALSILSWRNATGILDLAVLDEEADSTSGTYGRLFELAFDLLLRGMMKGRPSGRKGAGG